MNDKEIEMLKLKIIDIGKKMHEYGLTAGSWGNISARLPGRNLIIITPSGFDKSKLSPENLVIINTEGDIIEGAFKPSIETLMHLEVYEKRKDVNAIVHTHSPIATSVGIAGMEIPPISVELVSQIGNKIPLAKYACPGTKKLGENVVEALKNANAAIMEGHGVIAIGPDLDTAFTRALIVEEASKLFLFANLLGKPRTLTLKEIDEMRNVGHAWTSLKEIRNIKRDWEEKVEKLD